MNAVMKKVMRTANALAVSLYRRSNGRIGGSAKGKPLLLLTVPGRKTGTPHTVAVAYFEHNGCYLVTGSAGGMKDDPQWIRNLRVVPRAQIQIGAEKTDVQARVSEPTERDQLWRDVVLAEAPFFAGYQEKCDRVIPIAVLNPTREQNPGSDLHSRSQSQSLQASPSSSDVAAATRRGESGEG